MLKSNVYQELGSGDGLVVAQDHNFICVIEAHLQSARISANLLQVIRSALPDLSEGDMDGKDSGRENPILAAAA